MIRGDFMSKLKQKLLEDLANCVIEMEDERVVEVAKRYVECGFDPYEGIEQGLSKGMEQVGQLFNDEEYYIPELLICSDAMYEGINVLKEKINIDHTKEKFKAVVGVVLGDTHDIGKNIYKIMLMANGFEVHDLGRDVPCEAFIEKAKEINAHLIGMSTLMTTTMSNMERVIELLEQQGMRENIVVMVGGGPISQQFALHIGADGYEHDASSAAKLAKCLVEGKGNRISA